MKNILPQLKTKTIPLLELVFTQNSEDMIAFHRTYTSSIYLSGNAVPAMQAGQVWTGNFSYDSVTVYASGQVATITSLKSRFSLPILAT